MKKIMLFLMISILMVGSNGFCKDIDLRTHFENFPKAISKLFSVEKKFYYGIITEQSGYNVLGGNLEMKEKFSKGKYWMMAFGCAEKGARYEGGVIVVANLAGYSRNDALSALSSKLCGHPTHETEFLGNSLWIFDASPNMAYLSSLVLDKYGLYIEVADDPDKKQNLVKRVEELAKITIKEIMRLEGKEGFEK